MKYKYLVAELNLNTNVSTTEKLDRLKIWCQENISRDIQFSGKPIDAYENYQNLAEFFLDEVLPIISENISIPHEELDGLNAIQFAANAGFDRWILTLNPNNEAVNKPDLYLMTPLHMAALEGNYHTVKALCALKANPQAENNNKQLPIFSALISPVDGHKSLKARKLRIFKALKNIDPKTLKHQDNSGNTILHLIATYGYESLIGEVLRSVPELFTIPNRIK